MLENNSDNSTLKNYQLYTMTKAGKSLVSVAAINTYLGITTSATDPFIQDLIDACMAWGQTYTGRDFTVNNYTLLIDAFETRILLRRNPIDSISSVKHLVSGSLFTVPNTVYYLKKGVQISEILLNDGQEWPTDGDDREQGIQIDFISEAIGPDKLPMATNAIKRHVAYMFENRGDCGDCGDCSGADAANVTSIYNLFRIPRI